MIFVGIKANIFLGAAYFYPWIKTALIALVPKSLKQTRAEHMSLTREKLLKRMSLGAERPDLMEGLLRKKEEMNLSVHKLQMTSSLLIIAGSETTATALSAVTYLLATHPGPLRRITEEVRSAFGAEDEIDFTAVNRLQYMLACLDEAIRVYPPAPVGLPRQIHKGGANIAGYYVPEDVSIAPPPGLFPLSKPSIAIPLLIIDEAGLEPRNDADNPLPFLPLQRQSCPSTSTPCTTGRSSSPRLMSFTLRGGLETRGSRQTTGTCSSRSMLARGTALAASECLPSSPTLGIFLAGKKGGRSADDLELVFFLVPTLI